MEPPGILIVGVIYMFMPALCAVVVQKLIYKAPLKKPLRINFRPNRWFLVAWLLPVLIAFATFGVALLFPGVTFSPDKQDNFRYLLLKPEQFGIEIETNRFAWAVFLTLLQGLVTGITVNALAGFGEELGWRGFLQRELGGLGFWKASAIIGLVWGFWHAPLIVQGFNYPEHPWAGVFLMTVESLLLAPLFSYVCLKADSVVAAAIFHGTCNGMSVLATMGLEGGNDLLVGVTADWPASLSLSWRTLGWLSLIGGLAAKLSHAAQSELANWRRRTCVSARLVFEDVQLFRRELELAAP